MLTLLATWHAVRIRELQILGVWGVKLAPDCWGLWSTEKELFSIILYFFRSTYTHSPLYFHFKHQHSIFASHASLALSTLTSSLASREYFTIQSNSKMDNSGFIYVFFYNAAMIRRLSSLWKIYLCAYWKTNPCCWSGKSPPPPHPPPQCFYIQPAAICNQVKLKKYTICTIFWLVSAHCFSI